MTRHGEPAAVIISQEEIEYFEALEDYFDINEATKAVAEAEREGWTPWEEYLRDEP